MSKPKKPSRKTLRKENVALRGELGSCRIDGRHWNTVSAMRAHKIGELEALLKAERARSRAAIDERDTVNSRLNVLAVQYTSDLDTLCSERDASTQQQRLLHAEIAKLKAEPRSPAMETGHGAAPCGATQ
jgi:hypothetical protein